MNGDWVMRHDTQHIIIWELEYRHHQDQVPDLVFKAAHGGYFLHQSRSLPIPGKNAIQSDANKPPIPAPTLPVILIQNRQSALLHNTPKA
ncbi:hypothetical protein [Rhodoferax ferrireducens]|uniref:hypothetical protein n=1 Tax=Rhodoferax ferrireducens TaxID=192843 RepID=UPI000059A8BA|nr:hypothetical protein [Rhodoferax ferrireducens]